VINPGDPWVDVEKVNFKPTPNLEFGFERTSMFGGEGHSPVTLHTFLKSFFSLSVLQPMSKTRATIRVRTLARSISRTGCRSFETG
jgi:hypothetical protein